MLTRRTWLLGAAGALTAGQWSLSSRAHAQIIQQTTRVVVPFPAGGSTDALARILADKLKGVYAPTTLVENRVGAAGRLAVEYVKSAEADGSVMLFTPDFPITVYPHSFRSLSYDPVRDFTPVATIAKSALCLCVGPAVPDSVKTLSDFVAWCKANPTKATHATTAAGGTPHFAGLMLSQVSKVPMTPVHYKGGAPALQDLIGGHVTSSVNPVAEVLPFAKSGKIRPLAVTSAKRTNFLPDVPTMKESGYDVVIESWLGTLVPSKTPADIVTKLNAAIKDAFAAPDVKEKLATLGNEPDYKTPAEFAAMVKADIERWGPVVKASGFVAD
ncbi:Bug family tripartite tricarboxylate transporter substrate binding protein [Pseudorhodoplanes sp.]|jgi:tripartite-type tricarboxylate transporter receptor subunit TctC|uniref:Bug family tripartite tricarboxylate transporter substrate binding protein n=1 Tax=Pseudorhodoplanes sp. TaxID=1934341 RepID=UPI002BF116C3|nr:Bug family tripartite tricarboxylate transporter substrate binding protein [Pseudorhodoplanes sp.]HWV43765.1 Bug family tripartite tricarboxylate transporter substrate binding protein [Pseudorhodoplanes sp.]